MQIRCVNSCLAGAKWFWLHASVLLLLPLTAPASGAPLADADPPPAGTPDPAYVQAIVDDFRDRLALPSSVRVSVVPTNDLKMSVQNVDDGEFLLLVEKDFLGELTEDELKAAIAHELGHVWIFTHHPYLQTEALANQIAGRLVTRESLERMYEKVWKDSGAKGDLARFVAD